MADTIFPLVKLFCFFSYSDYAKPDTFKFTSLKIKLKNISLKGSYQHNKHKNHIIQRTHIRLGATIPTTLPHNHPTTLPHHKPPTLTHNHPYKGVWIE